MCTVNNVYTVELHGHCNLCKHLLHFVAEATKSQYCKVKLTDEKYQAFVYAVKNHYWYQMYIDDLPIWGK